LPPAPTGEEQERRLQRVMGREFLEHVVRIDEQRGGLALHGWVAEPRFNRALTLLSEFWPSVMECPQFQQEWARLRNGGLKEWQVNMFYADWLEALFLAQERHPRNAEGLVREWVLAFLEKGPALRGWCRIPLPERRLLVRVWEGIARQTLAE